MIDYSLESTLHPKELFLWEVIRARSGLLFMRGTPGIGKSAIVEEIARKMGLVYVPLHLSIADETDFNIPTIDKKKIGDKIYAAIVMAYPDWAIESLSKPCLIHLEELNRCNENVQNAVLGIINERKINSFSLGEDTYMVSSGNKGMEDGTNVNEFDSALKGRLIQMDYTMSYDEWCELYATKNVNPLILDFLKKKTTIFNKYLPDSDASPSPRTWTNLSNYIRCFGKDVGVVDIINKVSSVASGYVGPAGDEFVKYLRERTNISIDEIFFNTPISQVEKEIGKMHLVTKMALLDELIHRYPVFEEESVDFIDRLKIFISNLSDDMKVKWVNSIVRNSKFTEESVNMRGFFKNDFMRSAIDIIKKYGK